MSEENVKIVLSAEDQATAAIKKLTNELQSLKKMVDSFKSGLTKGFSGLDTGSKVQADFTKGQDAAMRGLNKRFTFETRMNRQRLGEERAIGAEQDRQDRARRTAEDASMRQFRDRMSFQARMIRQQAGMERDAERARASAIRDTARQTRDQERRHSDVRRSASGAYRSGGQLSGEVVGAARQITVMGAAGTAALTKIGHIGLEARSRIDAAEANLRMFGGQTRDQVNAARSGWLNRAAVENGFRPDRALNALTETLKAGIPEAAAKAVTTTIMGASAGLDLDVPDTTKLVGRLATLTQDPNKGFDAGQIERTLNGIAVVAKVTAADSKELVSSLRRGAGVLGASKMSVGDLTAFTGVGISAGMQEGKAGTFMDFQVNELVNAKNARGQRRQDLAKGAQLAGLGSLENVSRQAANDPTTLLLKLYERMNKMSPQKAAQVARLIGMREWSGEMLMMSKASPMLRQTVEAERDPKNANHLKQARDEKLGTLPGLKDQLVATFDLAWEAVGGGIEDIVREISTFFLDFGKFTDFDVIKAHVHTLLDGFVDGLGFKNITEMLESAFGKPGKMDYSSLQSFFDFARGFGQGVREVFDNIKGLISAFTGPGMKAEGFGKLTAEVLGLAGAMTIVSPYVAVLGGIATALGGFAITIGSISTALGAAGLTGGAALVKWIVGGLGLSIVAAIGEYRGQIATMLGAPKIAGLLVDGVKAFLGEIGTALRKAFSIKGIVSALKSAGAELVPAPIQRLLNNESADSKDENKDKDEGIAWGDPPARVEKQAFDVDTTGSIAALVKKASYTGYDDRDDETRRVANGVEDLRSLLQKAALTTGGGPAAALGASSGGGGGGSSGGSSRGSERFFTPPDMKVPDWFGKGRGVGGLGGSGGGSATSNPANSVASAAMLDAIAGTESGKGGYDAVLGNGKYGMPSKPVSTMSLDEAFRFGRTVKARHGSSSALGRYQIVGNTMRAAQQALGISGDAKFDQATQDRMARWIARNQGLGAWEGLKSNPRAMAAARAALAQGGAKDVPGGGAVASIDPNLGVPGLGQYGGLKLKGDQARAGGGASLGVTDLARQAQDNLPGGVKAFTAFNDRYHLGTRSKHAQGLAFDTTLLDPSKSREAAEAMREKLRAAGLVDQQFKVIDEYLNPSARSTGGHIHTQFNDQASAKQYHDAISAKANKAVAGIKAIGDKARAAESVQLREGVVDAGSGIKGVPFGSRPSVDAAVSNVPPGIGRGGSGGASGGGKGGNTYHVTQNINGAGERPEEVANKVQRTLTADWNHRNHDLEPELV